VTRTEDEIIELLAEGPATSQAIATHLGVSLTTARNALRRHALRKWVVSADTPREGRRGRPAKLWSLSECTKVRDPFDVELPLMDGNAWRKAATGVAA
jgi:predicted ArsR family transcriptional regulator